MAQWYIQVMGEATGPFTPQELKKRASSDKLTPTDMVRKGEDGEWVSASDVRGLFEGQSASHSHESAPPESQAMWPPGHDSERQANLASDYAERAEWWYVTKGFFSSFIGPLPAETLRELAKTGKITPSTQVRHDSQDHYQNGDRFPWIFDASLPLPKSSPLVKSSPLANSSPLPEPKSDPLPAQAGVENKTEAWNSPCPKRQDSLNGLADFAGIIGAIGIVLALVCGVITLATLSGEKGQQYASSLISLVVMLLISSLLWFIIAGALRAFEHLIQVSEFTAEKILNIELSLREQAATQDGSKRDDE